MTGDRNKMMQQSNDGALPPPPPYSAGSHHVIVDSDQITDEQFKSEYNVGFSEAAIRKGIYEKMQLMKKTYFFSFIRKL
jgi:hypothetical protein